MFSITHIYVQQFNRVEVYTPSQITLDSLISKVRNGEGVIFAISVYSEKQQQHYGLDIMTILQERCIPNTDTWQSVANQITDEWIEGYRGMSLGYYPGSDMPRKTARLIHPITTKGMSIHYVDMHSPDNYDIFQFRWGMPDLMIEQHDTKLEINLSNCICISNGMASFSHMYNNKMYVHDGAKHLWNTTDTIRPSVVLWDMTPIGNLSLHRLNDCKKKFRNIANADWTNSEWEFTLPDDISFLTHSVILVVGGIMYLPGEYNITSNKSIGFHPEILMLDKQLLHKYKCSAHLKDTIYQTENTVSEYLRTTMWSEDSHDSFIVAIDNPHMFIHTKEVTPYVKHRFGIVDFNGGILRQRSTKLIYTYMASMYNTQQLLYTDNHLDSYFFDTEYLGNTPGTEFVRLDNHYFENLQESVFDLIHLCSQ